MASKNVAVRFKRRNSKHDRPAPSGSSGLLMSIPVAVPIALNAISLHRLVLPGLSRLELAL